MSDAPISLLLCDDHRLLTDALSMVVERDAGLVMVHEPVSQPEKAVELCGELHPDVVLMDVSFEGVRMTGIEATRRIKQVSPETNVVIVTGQEEERLLVEAIEAGASGFVPKSGVMDDVLTTVRAAAAGEVLVDPATLARLLHEVARQREVEREAAERFASLTERERDVLELFVGGGRNEDIAALLHVSPATVQSHVHGILTKLGVRSKLEAVTFAVRSGAIDVS